ncbi:helix-turn-helix domain-containing protein [Rhodocytophaga rosea]|uniref:Helix-turn-helix domain-containing protein n=1 Tax=Rhodocytophaga rosea TaxID=2704465 RepID=A0A6C0GPG5_9BACT|nr:helix-turn-helix domain-containing protein [Rhodocytophaga rosea]QHT69955.1 helix-turn-helix domain-containing protein [Rhodocytophaga rosea]
MKHVSILIPKGHYSIVNIAGAFQILEAANDLYFQKKGLKLFEIELVSNEDPAREYKGLYTINPTRKLQEVTQSDLIIVPAVHADITTVLEENKAMVRWIKERYNDGAEVASFCIGIYLVAEAGILNGKVCSTHWAHAQQLKSRFPSLDIRDENFITDDRGVYTSGGAYAFTNLILYLIEKFGGKELAIQIAKAFMIDLDKGSQATFMVFNGQKDHHDEVVLKVQQYIETNFEEKFTVDELAATHATIRRTLERRFKKATGNSVNEYTQRVRIEAAKKQLEMGRKTVNEVMYEVGYSDGKAFREVFKKYAGISPVDYRQKFGYSKIEYARV